MTLRSCLSLLVISLAARANAAPIRHIRLDVSNPANLARSDAPVVVSVKSLQSKAHGFNPVAFLLRDARGRIIPAQADDLDGDGRPDEIAFEIDLGPHKRQMVDLEYGAEADVARLRSVFPKRAHASFQKKYEGMGWESDRVAWRLYFDKRNAIDMYGKRRHGLALDYFARPGVNYHAESPIGRDVYGVGDALGIGAVGAVVNGRIEKVADVQTRIWKVRANGPVRAIADLIYIGWDINGKKVNLTSRITVWAGQHWFEHAVTLRNGNGINLVAALPRQTGVPMSAVAPGAIATWGHQVVKPGGTSSENLPDGYLGLGLIVPGGAGDASDDANYAIRVPLVPRKDGTRTGRWVAVSAWDQEAPDNNAPGPSLPTAVYTSASWSHYIANLRTAIIKPIRVRLVPK